MTNFTNELNLCKGCNTMKHLDADGYCGRCVTTDMTYKKLQEQLNSLLWSHAKLDTDVRIDKEIIEFIQLFATLCTEVIGEDSINPPPLGDFWAVGRNQLRAEQRKSLAQLTTKPHDN